MKVLVVVGVFPAVSETFIVNQITYLLDAGHEVRIYAYRKGDMAIVNDAVVKYDLLARCTWHTRPATNFLERLVQLSGIIKAGNMNWPVFFRSVNIFKFGGEALRLMLAFKAQWFLVKDSYDIIHVHFANNAIDIARLMKSGVIPVKPMVVSFHGYDLEPSHLVKLKEYYEPVFKSGCAFTVNSSYTLAMLRTIFNGDQVFKLPVGLYTHFFKPAARFVPAGEKITVIFCGRLINWKAPDLAIEIVRALILERGYRQLQLKIIGDGPMKNQLQELIEKDGLEQHVFLTGALTQEQILNELSAADIFLYPGIHDPHTQRAENQGLVIQEAQSMQLPVVISDAGGMAEGIQDGVTGFMVKEGDVSEFVNKMEALLLSRELRHSMGVAGRKFVQATFDMTVLGEQLISIYNNVIQRAGNQSDHE